LFRDSIILLMDKRKGFTLAELLIVVAIIAVLAGISIPVFSNQLEKSREATDFANVRAAYAEMKTFLITKQKDANSHVEIKYGIYGEPTYTIAVDLKQKKNGFDTNISEMKIGEIESVSWLREPDEQKSCLITADENGNITIDWGGIDYRSSAKSLLQNKFAKGEIEVGSGYYYDYKNNKLIHYGDLFTNPESFWTAIENIEYEVNGQIVLVMATSEEGDGDIQTFWVDKPIR
ncbi:MAG: prepilin-type N-terminal cleavage/methylation domain-containing protein, partial [Erysipelotrichaceae bacterium]|nr:prepilin-type N-terminal cleavage/methylation domain-containing protein [Erysipelotrichaceae bacterium]